MQNTNKKPTVCSFFSGGGLLDLGFKDDFNIIWANEFNTEAAKSYQSNIGDHIVVGNINEIAKDMSKIPNADIYIGGPPCIDFSSNGANRGEKGVNGQLTWTYFNIIKAKKPKAFVMENVAGLAQKHKGTLEKLKQSFNEVGYDVQVETLNSAEFGTPQQRKRVFIIGFRNDLGTSFEFPNGNTHFVTVKDAFKGLSSPQTIKARDKVLGDIPNHTATWTNPSPERIKDLYINPRPNQRVGLKRLDWDKPSYTLTAHIAKDGREFLHPDEDRRISVREALRLMGVPDSYIIPRGVPLNQQYTLVGNGVAYQVAKALAIAIRVQLTNVDKQIKQVSSLNGYKAKKEKAEQLSFDDLLLA
ncbi:DNA cytosine methyltransferase [Priestia megaterium]|uniref:DNA (cytosine-5-)-methyltransferase n=1 Tax=Priestia megaterium TaxID=1404 RepID=A0A6M6E0L1_PRIMG|nr:DNA cytosine methyltransferase [Priestia megaterium]QJX80370.1 DNA (cytosine-5-)-methyltransferase [Priestia megaterium]